MKIRSLMLVVSICACNGNSSSDGTNGANGDPGSEGSGGAPGQRGPQGATGAQGLQGLSGTAAILLATDEVQPPVVQQPGHGQGWPPTGTCSGPEYQFTTTTGHILVQRVGTNVLSVDGAALVGRTGNSSPVLLLATYVTPGTHTLSTGRTPVDDWRHGTCTSDELARACQTMESDTPQCWCPPADGACPVVGTILITELAQ